MTRMLERAMQRLHKLPAAAQDSIAQKILLEVEEAQSLLPFDSPNRKLGSKRLGAQALLEFQRGETVPLTSQNL